MTVGAAAPFFFTHPQDSAESFFPDSAESGVRSVVIVVLRAPLVRSVERGTQDSVLRAWGGIRKCGVRRGRHEIMNSLSSV